MPENTTTRTARTSGRGIRDERESRDQSTREAQESIDESFLFENPGVLPKIKARPGYAQYWVRVRHGNSSDARNLLMKKRRGWQPRSADTVPKAFQDLAVQSESMGGVISTHDLVLMERRLDLQEKVVAHNKKIVDDMERSVKRNIFRDYQSLGGADTGFSAPDVDLKSRVERGTPMLQDGEEL